MPIRSLNITQQDIFEKPQNFNINLNCPDIEKEAGVSRTNLYDDPIEF